MPIQFILLYFTEEDGPELPTKADQEFRPFIRRLPEFKFWWDLNSEDFIILIIIVVLDTSRMKILMSLHDRTVPMLPINHNSYYKKICDILSFSKIKTQDIQEFFFF